MISRKDIQATCDDIVRAFAPERVIMVDARGHGLSDKPDTNYDTKTHAADLAGLIRALDLQKPKDNPKWDESEFGPWSEAKVQVSPNVVGLLSTIRRWQDVVSSIYLSDAAHHS